MWENPNDKNGWDSEGQRYRCGGLSSKVRRYCSREGKDGGSGTSMTTDPGPHPHPPDVPKGPGEGMGGPRGGWSLGSGHPVPTRRGLRSNGQTGTPVAGRKRAGEPRRDALGVSSGRLTCVFCRWEDEA